MIIIVNGESQAWENAAMTVADLLRQNKVEKPELVSVQVNGTFVDSKDYDSRTVAENDEVDFLYFVGGGKFL